jgi:general secretion pathway protein C
MRDPSELLSQARVLPKFEQGQMVGLQVNGIKPGSLFQEIGLQEGDVITQFNGIAINSPDQSAKIFSELANAAEFNVVVRGADGTESTKSFTPE